MSKAEQEDPGRGHGVAQPGGPKFNKLVGNLMGHKAEAGTTSTDHLAAINPSKTLPSTALKRNTDQWKKENPEEAAKDAQKRERPSRASSSSSIPSQATKGEDERTEAEKQKGQEGPRGRGPGHHEEEVQTDQGWFTGLLNTALGTGTGTTRESSAQETSDRTVVDSPSSEYTDSPAYPTPSTGQTSGQPDHRGSQDQSGEKPEKKASEVFEGRDGERESKLVNEAGKRPHGLAAVKKEEMPGPRNEIVLQPRVTHMHVSYVFTS